MNQLQEKIQIMRDAVAFKKTDRIPTISNYWTYVIHDDGETLANALYNYDVLEKCMCDFHKKYEFDLYNYIGDRNPLRMADAVDGNVYTLDKVNDILSIKDYCIMDENEYPELIANPVKFIWGKALPRKCKAFNRPDAFECFAKSAKESDIYTQFILKMKSHFADEFQVPNDCQTFNLFPIELIYMLLRGLKNFCLDLRRHYDEVLESTRACEFIYGIDSMMETFKYPLMDNVVFGAGLSLLGLTIVNEKQWQDFYWYYLEKLIAECVRTNRQLRIMLHGKIEPFIEYFQDVPKGILLFQIEKDDPFMLRKKLPNVAITGGMSTKLLGAGTKQECIDHAKKLCDELACDVGFIMSQNKMMSFKNDAKSENIKAVQDFCRGYSNKSFSKA